MSNEEKHISELRIGDTVVARGVEYTVGKNDVKNGFTGWTFRGDPYFETRGILSILHDKTKANRTAARAAP